MNFLKAFNEWAYESFKKYGWYKTIWESHRRIKFAIKLKNSHFVFLSSLGITEKKRKSLENNKIWKKESPHLTVYGLGKKTGQTVVVNLKEPDLFRLDDVLLFDLFSSCAVKIDYGLFKDELLRCACPAETREQRYYKHCESLLNFYLNNYGHQKDKCTIPQAFLDMYKYAIARVRGNSVLDVGSCIAAFPILLKLKIPDSEVTASDYNYGYLDVFATRYCKKNNIDIRFKKLDILSPDHKECYDTVTTIHTLEHFEEKDNAAVINNLVKITNKRLIMIVPFEDFITIKDHRQTLNKEKLEKIALESGLPCKIEKISRWNYSLIIDTDK